MKLTLRLVTMIIVVMSFSISVLTDQLQQIQSRQSPRARLQAQDLAQPLFARHAEQEKIRRFRRYVGSPQKVVMGPSISIKQNHKN